MPVEAPVWLRDLQGTSPRSVETKMLRTRFLVRTVALAYCSEGRLFDLAAGMNATVPSLSWMYSRNGRVTPENAVLMEKLCNGYVTRAELCPEMFGDTDWK